MANPSCAALTTDAAAVRFYDDRYAAGYMEDWPEWKQQRITQMVRQLDLPSTGSAIDFGCGQGVFAEVLRRALPGWTIYGTDLSDVAVKTAARRYPQCRFFRWSDASDEVKSLRCDLLFSHHVLEHVLDIDDTWERMAQLLKPAASMLLVLPCGDAGSFEHALCTLKSEGIDPASGNRFFYEEDGHVRRLDTRQLRHGAAQHGFALSHARYANRFWGALEWITAAGPDFIRTLTDRSGAIGAVAASRLHRWQVTLRVLSLLRMPIGKLRMPVRRALSLKSCAKLAVAAIAYPMAWPLDAFLRRAAEREWQSATTGSEMYVAFVRTPPPYTRPTSS